MRRSRSSALLTVRSQSRHGPIADEQQLGKLPYVAHREGRPWPSTGSSYPAASPARTTPSALGCSHHVCSPLSVAHGPTAVASPRPSAAGMDRSPAEAWSKRCGPARPARRAACSGVWHDTWADGSFEARSVVTGPGARIWAGWDPVWARLGSVTSSPMAPRRPAPLARSSPSDGHQRAPRHCASQPAIMPDHARDAFTQDQTRLSGTASTRHRHPGLPAPAAP